MAYTTIDDPSAYFQTALYTGNGGTLAVTNDGNSDMQPDWVWAKSRTQANSHVFFDVVRTFAGDKEIQSNNTGAEGASDSAGYGYISAVGSDGFTAQAGSTAGDYTNVNNQNYVAWQWKAGTSFSNDASSTSVGSIDSTGSVNTDAGFSIIAFTGNNTNDATIAHGLGTTPAMIITKNREDAVNWRVWHKNLPNATDVLFLNDTNAAVATSGHANGYIKTVGSATYSTHASNSDANGVNGDGDAMIAYCFAEKQGYSKFGSYKGNGNADGTFVYLGFKPAWVLVKNTADTDDWTIWDNKREDYAPGNPNESILVTNNSDAELDATARSVDFLSNGFKLRTNNTEINTNAEVYIYMAFAENPFVSSTGIPTPAR